MRWTPLADPQPIIQLQAGTATTLHRFLPIRVTQAVLSTNHRHQIILLQVLAATTSCNQSVDIVSLLNNTHHRVHTHLRPLILPSQAHFMRMISTSPILILIEKQLSLGDDVRAGPIDASVRRSSIGPCSATCHCSQFPVNKFDSTKYICFPHRRMLGLLRVEAFLPYLGIPSIDSSTSK